MNLRNSYIYLFLLFFFTFSIVPAQSIIESDQNRNHTFKKLEKDLYCCIEESLVFSHQFDLIHEEVFNDKFHCLREKLDYYESEITNSLKTIKEFNSNFIYTSPLESYRANAYILDRSESLIEILQRISIDIISDIKDQIKQKKHSNPQLHSMYIKKVLKDFLHLYPVPHSFYQQLQGKDSDCMLQYFYEIRFQEIIADAYANESYFDSIGPPNNFPSL